jgi:hypothetical protein
MEIGDLAEWLPWRDSTFVPRVPVDFLNGTRVPRRLGRARKSRWLREKAPPLRSSTPPLRTSTPRNAEGTFSKPRLRERFPNAGSGDSLVAVPG